MEWILGIDTASTELGIGLICDGKPIFSFSRYIKNSHAEHIAGAIAYMLKSVAITADDISLCAVSVGPGSFTGLRIGISFIKGMLLLRDVPVLPISSLESLAFAASANINGNVVAAMDARRNNIFCSKFEVTDDDCKHLSKDHFLDYDSFLTFIDLYDTIVIDTLGYDRSTVFNLLPKNKRIIVSGQFALQRGLACAKLGYLRKYDKAIWLNSLDLLPNYMQQSYAEQNKNN